MPNPRLASRYAKALIDLSLERNQLEPVYTDMQWLQQLTKSNRDFVNFLRSPVIKADKKIKIVDAVTAGNVSGLTQTYTTLLINKGREGDLPEIITAFISQYKELKNIYPVRLTTAVPVTEEIKKAIISQIQKTSDMQDIELETVVDDSLIGGFVLQAGDKMVDASIAHDLKIIARQFENNDFIYKVR